MGKQRYCRFCSRQQNDEPLMSLTETVDDLIGSSSTRALSERNRVAHYGDVYLSMGRKGRWMDVSDAFYNDEVWTIGHPLHVWNRSRRLDQGSEAEVEGDVWYHSNNRAFRSETSPKQAELDELRADHRERMDAQRQREKELKNERKRYTKRRDHRPLVTEAQEQQQQQTEAEVAEQSAAQQQQKKIKKRGRGVEPQREDWEAEALDLYGPERWAVVQSAALWKAVPELNDAAKGLKLRDTRTCSCRSSARNQNVFPRAGAGGKSAKGGRRAESLRHVNDTALV